MNYVLHALLVIALILSACAVEESGNLPSLSSYQSPQGSQNCVPNAAGLALNDGQVAYWPDIRTYINSNCVSCHGIGNQQQANVNLLDYAKIKSTLAARSLTPARIVQQINNNHQGSHNSATKTLFAAWQTSEFIEFLPGKSLSDYQNTGGNNNNSGGNNDIPDSIQDRIDGLNDFLNQNGENPGEEGGSNSDQTFSNQSANQSAQPCL